MKLTIFQLNRITVRIIDYQTSSYIWKKLEKKFIEKIDSLDSTSLSPINEKRVRCVFVICMEMWEDKLDSIDLVLQLFFQVMKIITNGRND